MATIGSLGGSGNECRHTSIPFNTASYRGIDRVDLINTLDEEDNGFSKSC